MTILDLTTSKYALQSNKPQVGQDFIRKIRIKGSDITKLSQTASDAFKICNLGQKVRVIEHAITVLNADDTALTLKSGYTDGTNTDDDAFDADVALNSTGVTEALDNKKFLYDEAVAANFFWILTFSALATLDDDTEFICEIRCRTYDDVPFTSTVNAPV